MRKSRFSEEQIIGMLREQEGGRPTAEVCRKHGGQWCDLLQVEVEVRRHGRLRRQPAALARGREREAEEAACRDDARQRDPEGHHIPKVVTPVAKRQAVAYACTTHEVSERRAYQALGIDRSTVRYRSLRRTMVPFVCASGSWHRSAADLGTGDCISC